MSQIGAEEILAAVVALWFGVAGLLPLFVRAPQGRRAVVAQARGATIARLVRSGLFLAGAIAVAADAACQVLGLAISLPGRALGLGLAALSLWPIGEASRPPIRWLPLLLYGAGFVLAVCYAGFRA